MPISRNEIRERMLEKVRQSSVQAEWWTDTGEPSVSLRLPYNCKFGGTLWTPSDGVRNFSFDTLSVPGALRKHHIATRLVRALTHVALTITEEYEVYGGSISSPHVARILGNMFDAQRLSYELSDYGDSEPLTADEALKHLQRGGDVVVAIDLANLPVQNFETPVFPQE